MKQLVYPLSVAAALAVLLVLCSAPSVRAGDWPEDCGNNKSHNFHFGSRNWNDRILYVEQVIKSSSLLRKLSFDVDVPAKGAMRSPYTITAIEVQDQFHNGKGGCAYLKSGGPGFNHVTLHIKSQRGEGVNFIVNVYGH